MDSPSILVTGANGQLGKELRRLAASYPRFRFVFLSREDLAIHHFDLVRNYFKTLRPDFCINCAAYTAVDRAEEESALAFQVNAEAVGVLAAVCKEYETRFIHISTDYVFDGHGTTPYKEHDAPAPQTVYGASKLKGEEEALRFHPGSIIIRTSWVYSEYGKNFVKTMLRLMKERQRVNVVNDQTGSPTYAADLATTILAIADRCNSSEENCHSGIYHYSSQGVITWYDFAMTIREMAGLSCQVDPIPSSQYPTPAKRPVYSAMDTGKIQRDYDLQIPGWKESLRKCIDRIRLSESA